VTNLEKRQRQQRPPAAMAALRAPEAAATASTGEEGPEGEIEVERIERTVPAAAALSAMPAEAEATVATTAASGPEAVQQLLRQVADLRALAAEMAAEHNVLLRDLLSAGGDNGGGGGGDSGGDDDGDSCSGSSSSVASPGRGADGGGWGSEGGSGSGTSQHGTGRRSHDAEGAASFSVESSLCASPSPPRCSAPQPQPQAPPDVPSSAVAGDEAAAARNLKLLLAAERQGRALERRALEAFLSDLGLSLEDPAAAEAAEVAPKAAVAGKAGMRPSSSAPLPLPSLQAALRDASAVIRMRCRTFAGKGDGPGADGFRGDGDGGSGRLDGSEETAPPTQECCGNDALRDGSGSGLSEVTGGWMEAAWQTVNRTATSVTLSSGDGDRGGIAAGGRGG
ncbi:unnamed protein product, partial [Phaeothamnion confervicola]